MEINVINEKNIDSMHVPTQHITCNKESSEICMCLTAVVGRSSDLSLCIVCILNEWMDYYAYNNTWGLHLLNNDTSLFDNSVT